MARRDNPLDELIKIAEDGTSSQELTKTQKFLKTDSVVRFMVENGLQSGNYKVHRNSLYLYYAYGENEPVSTKIFHKRMKFYVKYVNEFYYLNKSVYSISAPLHERMMQKHSKTPRPQHAKSVIEFYKAYDISRGTFYVDARILYEIFQEWRARGKKRGVQRREFHSISKNVLNFKIRGRDNILYFGLKQRLEENIYTRDIAERLGRKYNEKETSIKTKSKRLSSPRS